MKRILLILLLTVSGTLSMVAASRGKTLMGNRQIYAGGRIGVGVPTAIGRSAEQVAFSDVASVGFAAKGDCMWMASNFLGIGGEVGFNKYPYKEQFWTALNQRGSFDATYKTLTAGITGRAILGTKDLKPYFGMSVDANYMCNQLKFTSIYEESESVDYESKQVKPGFGIEMGIFFKVAKTAYLSVALRGNILPYLKEEVMTTYDEYSYQEKKVVVNPHGKQNTIEALVGLHFSTKKDTKRMKH